MPDEGGNELTFSPALGREIRSAPAGRLGTPTDVLFLRAVEAGDQEEATRLFRYLVDEAGRVFTVLTAWFEGQLDYGQRHVGDWPARLELLARIIGAPPPATPVEEFAALEVREMQRLLDEWSPGQVPAALERVRATQWKLHDELTDWLWGLLTQICDALGEDAMGDVLRVTVKHWFDTRYAALPALSPKESFELVIEGARGHFSGPDHSGNIAVEEDNEKWVMSFDPCGSGGRMRRGDAAMGQTSRSEPPYSFGFAERAHDWTWQEPGVCLYCAHCSFANEILAIEQQGTPMRVTHYPPRPDEQCTWTIYKRREDVPDSAYQRVGKTPPAR